ncbi:olfactory receptor 12D2-like [Eleutherodactylus coqui]|uniref:olfactory receptor 12D2-like n=1 Tax=Eleutherodactylus coqui TaxID=57060 RepID=UPI00346222E0
MEKLNETFVREFIFLGITNHPQLQFVLFVTFLMFYLLNITGNLSIVIVVMANHGLHTPMYFFLGNLSFLDFFFATTTVPKMLSGLLFDNKKISFQGCIAQLYFLHFLGSTEGMLLASMSYDRYIAICNPLRYHVLMARVVCLELAFTSWLVGSLYSLLHTILTSMLPFCNMNKVTHFCCDIKPLLKLACADTHINESLLKIVTGSIGLSTFVLIIISYTFIGTHLHRIRSEQGRSKAFSTCTSHLTVVFLFFGTSLSTFLRPSTKDSLEHDRIAAVLFTIITPALNPIIYALRNKDVKMSLRKLFFNPKNFLRF